MPFQSTRPRGARLNDLEARYMELIVSIHAPAWGATATGRRSPAIDSGFNPRARVGRDICGFQDVPDFRSFNPRARVGRDA